ncbi:hypothetical protein GW17_00047043 [Ensete ventricosum]|nr:hypothetical protein GW17_00047043 [Ensete ventricosum]
MTLGVAPYGAACGLPDFLLSTLQWLHTDWPTGASWGRWLETWRNYALRESVESKDKVSGSGKLGVIVRELGEWQSIIDPRVPEHSPTCRWGPLVSSCVASGGIYGVTKRLGWALGDIDRGGIINYTN